MVKETRKNIILSWFQYAYQFVNLKLKPGFNEEKNKQTSHQSGEDSFFEEEKDEIIDFIPEKVELRKTQSFVQSPSLFEPKAKKIPGVSKNELKDIVKEYNNNITPKDIEKLKTSAKQLYQPENFFPKIIQNSEFDFKAKGLSIILIDQEIKIK